MTTSQKAAQNRKTLEAKNQLPHNQEFEIRVRHEQKNTLLLLAALTAVVLILFNSLV